jgi:hypothetical protein
VGSRRLSALRTARSSQVSLGRAAQEHGVDVGEVDREDRVGLRDEKLAPGRTGPLMTLTA